MTWQRILTAAILVPLFLLLIFKSSPAVFQIVTAVVVLWAVYEWANLMGLRTYRGILLYFIIFIAATAGALFLPMMDLLGLTIFWWLLAAVLVFSYPRGEGTWKKGYIFRGIMGVMTLVPTWILLNLIRFESDSGTLLYLFLLIWVADSGAWFFGKFFGRHRLLPSVSPGKTWEGLVGALLLVLPLIGFAIWYGVIPQFAWPLVILFSLVTVLFSVLGDLFESMIKRAAGVKDSGRLLPGHGGLLDRIDSLTAATPIYFLGLIALYKTLAG
ncbi:MAG: phosphatidate cytidylyltransferase [Gammaproteobacteria bacterium]|nr:phosphatidate cytidylyltransferase [Gammaproteobacteria bacterium]